MVLFDEVEKAHADVFNILLQVSLPFQRLLTHHTSSAYAYNLHNTSIPEEPGSGGFPSKAASCLLFSVIHQTAILCGRRTPERLSTYLVSKDPQGTHSWLQWH